MNTTSCSVLPRQPKMFSSTPSNWTPVSSWPISSANSRRTVSSAYSPNSTCPPSGRWNGAERARKWRSTRSDVLRHQQRPVPRPPDDRHRLEDLPGIRHRCHQPVLSRPRVSGRAYHFVTQTVEPGGRLSREFVCGEHEGGVTGPAVLVRDRRGV